MRSFYLLFFLGVVTLGNAQSENVTFSYDTAGNQIVRELCIGGCLTAKKGKSDLKEIADLVDEDLEKFSADDIFSYYPNPVKEELYLQWELNSEKLVSGIQVFSLNGQLLNNFQPDKKNNQLTISFQSYPVGIYLIQVIYTSGEIESIKIIKK